MKYQAPFFMCSEVPCGKIPGDKPEQTLYLIPVGIIVLPEEGTRCRVISKEEAHAKVTGLSSVGKISDNEAKTLRTQIEESGMINYLDERVLRDIHESLPEGADGVLMARKPLPRTHHYCQN